MSKLKDLQNFKKTLDQTSPSFCLAKWKHATIHLHNGHTQSCHHVRSHQVDFDDLDQPSNLHNTPKKLRARQKMLKGERPPECRYCWKVEDRGQLSDRIHKSSESPFVEAFDQVIASGLGETINPSFLEVSFDNTCQFKCIYCNPAYSSRWQKEVQEFGPYPTIGNFINKNYNASRLQKPNEQREKYIDAFWRWWPELSQELSYIRVTGGEPFLSKETFRLIDQLIAEPKEKLSFAINTNMGFSDNQFNLFMEKVGDLQSSVEQVLIFTSMDTVGEQAEYIRYGLDYNDFCHKTERLLKTSKPGLVLCFMITVNILCLPGLKKLMEFIVELKAKYPQHQINIDTPYLRQPEVLSVELLTEDFTQYIHQTIDFMKSSQVFRESEIQKTERISSLIVNKKYPKFKKALLRKDFARMIQEYDRRKQISFLKTFPEYADFWQLCQSINPLRLSL